MPIDFSYVHIYNVHMTSVLDDLLQTCDGFEWNEGNLTKNWLKHQVGWSEIEEIFLNKPLIISNDTKHSGKETQYHALGKTNNNKGLFISFTVRGRKIRIISARDQSKKEREFYEQIT